MLISKFLAFAYPSVPGQSVMLFAVCGKDVRAAVRIIHAVKRTAAAGVEGNAFSPRDGDDPCFRVKAGPFKPFSPRDGDDPLMLLKFSPPTRFSPRDGDDPEEN